MALSDDTKRTIEDKLGYGPGKEVGELLDITDVLSGAEVAFIDGVTAGTAAAGKALVLDGNLDIATIRHVTINGNLVTGSTTLSEADLAKIDGITNGTQAASKAIVNDTNVNQGVAKVTALHIGTSGSETQVNATAAEINQACDESANSEVVTTTNIIAATESSKTFYLNAAGGFTSTLPAPALGLRFRFIIKTAPTTAYIITTTNGDNILFGMMLERAGTAGVAGAARDTFNFVANLAIIGDWVDFYCDGTNYYYHGMVDAAAGNTVAAT